jgi:hypothetical protein
MGSMKHVAYVMWGRPYRLPLRSRLSDAMHVWRNRNVPKPRVILLDEIYRATRHH